MKKLLILTLSSVVLLFTACNREDKLEVTPNPLEFSFAGGPKSVTVAGPGTWTAANTAAWLTVPASGDAGEIITITATENATTNARTASITFTSGSETTTLVVNQAGKYDLEGVWTLEWLDEDGWYEDYFTIDSEDWITIRDTISRRTANSFSVFRFIQSTFGNPQPNIEFNGTEFVYRTRSLGNDFWQVPIAITLDGETFFVLDTIILDYDAGKSQLDANYEFTVRHSGNDYKVIPVLATFDGAARTWNTREDWVITPIFSRSSTSAAPGAKRAPAVRRTSDRVLVVPAESRVDNTEKAARTKR